jgi:hypothetical protein
MWVAPASRAAKALAMAQPVSLWPWNSMSARVSRRRVPTSQATWLGVAMPTVSAIPSRFTTPSRSTARYTRRRSAGSLRKVSSVEKRSSM